jgi:hypothetical protein
VSNFQPSLVYDEELATGWARVEIYGNPLRGKAMLPRARTVLGQLKSQNGVGQRQVDDRDYTGGGGFFHRWATLPDGSKVHAFTNDGHDTLRIYPVGAVIDEEKKVKRPDDFDPAAYLWVGVRCLTPVRKDYVLDVWIVEPEGAQMRGVVGAGFGTSNTWTYPLYDMVVTQDGENSFVAEKAASAEFSQPSEALDLMWEGFGPGSGASGGQFSPGMIYGDHQIYSYVFLGGDGNFDGAIIPLNWSLNGLMFINGVDIDVSVEPIIGPFDPTMSDEQNAGEDRDFSGRSDNFHIASGRFGWDAVFWIDPFDALLKSKNVTKRAYDSRPQMMAVTKLLRDEKVIPSGSDQILEGNYQLVIHAYGRESTPESSRTGQEITGVPDLVGFFTRSKGCDFSNYMGNTGDEGPQQFEVEVRIGRLMGTEREPLPDPAENQFVVAASTFNFTLNCAQTSERESTTWPFGLNEDFDICAGDGGPNMGGPSYSQVININVLEQTAELSSLPISRVFGTGGYSAAVDQPRRTCAFLIWTAFPVPAEVDWPDYAGHALWEMLQAASSGAYGCSEIGNDLSEAECKALFASTSYVNGVHMYTPDGGLAVLGLPTTTAADWVAYDPPFDSTNFYWYFEFAIPMKNSCWNTYGIVVTSAGPFFEGSQNFVGLPGYSLPDCC